MCVYACLFLVSAHYWAPTVLSPDGKPFDKKLIKVLLGLPGVNVLIIVFLYEDKNLVNLGEEMLLLPLGPQFKIQKGQKVRDPEETCFLDNNNTKQHYFIYTPL